MRGIVPSLSRSVITIGDHDKPIFAFLITSYRRRFEKYRKGVYVSRNLVTRWKIWIVH